MVGGIHRRIWAQLICQVTVHVPFFQIASPPFAPQAFSSVPSSNPQSHRIYLIGTQTYHAKCLQQRGTCPIPRLGHRGDDLPQPTVFTDPFNDAFYCERQQQSTAITFPSVAPVILEATVGIIVRDDNYHIECEHWSFNLASETAIQCGRCEGPVKTTTKGKETWCCGPNSSPCSRFHVLCIDLPTAMKLCWQSRTRLLCYYHPDGQEGQIEAE